MMRFLTRWQRPPLWQLVVVGLILAALVLPWGIRFYGRYFEFALGAPCGAAVEFLMPRRA